MIVTMRVEQTPEYKMRMKYVPEDDNFIETSYSSLLYERGFEGVYGWIEGLGEPPKRHLDIFLSTQNKFLLGNRVKVKVVGCFLRSDGDNKIISIDEYRKENDIADLPIEELNMIKRMYPRVGENEGWFGKERALQLINEF